MKSEKHADAEIAKEYDAIVVGSGTAGATIARALVRAGGRVLVIERGRVMALNEKLSTVVSIADEVKLGEEGLSTLRALAAGGSSSLYFAVAKYPDLASFAALGINLSEELRSVQDELPIGPLPEKHFGVKQKRLKDSAESLGHAWNPCDMLIDYSNSGSGYSYDAKWKARSYLDDAIAGGASLTAGATVTRVLVEGGRAVGVEYALKRTFGSDTRRAYARRVVVAAGELATPHLLRDSGIPRIGDRGFYCNPGYALYGIVPGLEGGDGFVGGYFSPITEEVEIGDACIHRSLHRLMMLGGMKWRHMLSFKSTLGVGVKVKDDLGGELRADGRFHKVMSAADREHLALGREVAVEILEKAGAKHIVDFGLTAAGRVGGLLRIGEHVDRSFETEVRGLYVCDGSIIPDDQRGAPAVTILCMAKALSKILLAAA